MREGAEEATVAEALAWGTQYLAERGVAEARADARTLLCHAAGLTKAAVLTHPERVLLPLQGRRFRSLIARRGERLPLQYLMGSVEFMSGDFMVTPDTLIPRAETEILVERAVALLSGWTGPLLIADLGTGSGVIAVTLAQELPGAVVHAVDISAAAIGVARVNARRHGVESRVVFHEGDLWQPLRDAGLRGALAAVVSNPPYLAAGELAGLMPEVAGFEPRQALVAGETGVEFHRRIIAGAPDFLAPGGVLLLEVGTGQSGPATGMMMAGGRFADIATFNDYAGHGRVVAGRLSDPAAGRGGGGSAGARTGNPGVAGL